jgi:dipeptide/tripeptide permease
MSADQSSKRMFNILVLEFVERFAFYSFNAIFVLYVSHYFLTEA